MALAKTKPVRKPVQNQKALKIACRSADLIELDKLIHFQGKLKSLTEANYIKFRNQVMELGFSEPISIWINGKDHNVLNGHQRLTALKKMRDEEGIVIPPIPISLVEAKDLKEAKKKVLALTSHYGDMTTESLGNFLMENDLDIGDIADDLRFLDVEMENMTLPDFAVDPDRSANTKSSSPSNSSTPEIQLTEYKNEQSDAETYHADLDEAVPQKEGSKEYTADDFDNFDRVCPKCGFEFNDK